MTTLEELFPLDDLVDEVANGYVTIKMHPTLPLHIATYTRACQYGRRWNNITTRCRGLVFEDETNRVVAWPFPKFFNVAEHDAGYDYAPPLPDEPFTVMEKVDGSLGIVFWYDGAWRVASKGSFTSDQAVWAQQWLDGRDTSQLLRGVTYLCEIVYPENRIVVRYDPALTGLTLLGAFHSDGWEIPLAAVNWDGVGPSVKQWLSTDAVPIAALMAMAAENTKMNGTTATGTDEEGWVIRFASGVRAKIKYAEYVRLHKVLTGVNARDVWQYYGADRFHDVDPKILASAIKVGPDEAKRLQSIPGGAMTTLLDNVLDEFDQWLRGIMADLDRQFYDLTHRIAEAYDDARDKVRAENLPTDHRARYARYAAANPDPIIRSGMFLMFDRKDIGPHAWKAIRPAAATPFADDEEG